ncbi:hypothetical protein BBI11_09820 [Planococcus maritimus]|uniref:hypothetical protein n=1 Tax=Planococcus maritimus TaxID=192421 RepID=UPI00080F2C3D|nr:hypothetical protein [Planococcus maritimus]ANU17299.1 hypothetical protein BBI11_09820 [Planococcus maritimus]
MRRRDNIYFYISCVSITFSFILIYYFYEERFDFSDFLDIKTILTVLGTVFGAYFGAKTAGRYAIESVERQIESQEKKETKRETDKFLRVGNLFFTRISSIITISDLIEENFVKVNSENDIIENDILVDVAKKEVEKQRGILKGIDITEVWDEKYYVFLLSLMKIDDCAESLNGLSETLEKLDSHEIDSAYGELLKNSRKLNEHKIKLGKVLLKYNT